MISIQIKFFSMLRELFQMDQCQLELPENILVKDLLPFLFQKKERAENFKLPPLRYAVNESFVADETLLKDGDCVCLITPVAGGC